MWVKNKEAFQTGRCWSGNALVSFWTAVGSSLGGRGQAHEDVSKQEAKYGDHPSGKKSFG